MIGKHLLEGGKGEIYPYIHDFNNFEKDSSPYRKVDVTVGEEFTLPISLGSFFKIYSKQHPNWDIVITNFQNYVCEDILKQIQLVYQILHRHGHWIDLATSNFSRNQVYLSWEEYTNILNRTQFKVLRQEEQLLPWYYDSECLMS